MSKAPISEQELELATSSADGYVANISAVNRMAHEGKSFSGNERNCVFLNRGDAQFSTVSALSGWDMPDDSRGLALMDWDSDGRIDFWASNRNAPRLRFMHNQMKNTGNWLGIKLRGTSHNNRDAIGARVKVTLENGRLLIRSLKAGEGFASQSSKRLNFGLGDATEIRALSVTWPDGSTQSFPPPAINHYYQAIQENPTLQKLTFSPPQPEQTTSHQACNSSSAVRAPLRIPFPAPNLRFKDQNLNQFIEIKQLKKPLLVILWSQRCQNCRKEITSLIRSAKTIRDHLNLVFLCIDSELEDQNEASRLLKHLQSPWQSGVPNAATNSALAAIFNHTFPIIKDLPTPSSLLVSTNGNIVTLYNGAHSVDTFVHDAKQLAQTTGIAPDPKTNGRWLTTTQKINLLYIPRLLMEGDHLVDVADYVVRAHNQLLDHKEYPLLLTWIAEEYLKKNMNRHAAAFYKTASQTGFHNPVVLNNIAWQLATHHDPSFRNGKEALRCATRAVELSQYQEPGYLDTLAAAYAELGKFDQAIKIARQALPLAKKQANASLVQSLQKAVSLYANRQPMR
ncbi:ASPIC/UnbV domain-containing protein [Verrucomicrobiaceae bacterium N1E253]|uniref:ASPIC/UnbV domain-containing protein n=1 Tax=Oceaniferula marina TaxID=2748318 RepID=A0A851GIJ3_9BACT|nr:ASPIC/UnbV domain-containing protein [Oceaniferula marina]NWK54947.1 ASPIC/UnbV domain-containing protein [Oceaniferula marina]